MSDWLYALCKSLETTPWGSAVRTSLWGYPFVQLIHFTGLSLWVGTIAMIDLRFLGLVGKAQPAGQLAEELVPWTWTGLGIAVTGGFFLFSATATTFFHNPAFQLKLPLVLVGIAYRLLVQRFAPRWGQSSVIPPVAKLATFAELAIWLSVITAAVQIPNH